MSSTPTSSSSNQTDVSIRSEDLAHMVQGELEGNPNLILSTLAPIEAGTSGSLTFIRSQNFAKPWATSQCDAALVTQGIELPEYDQNNKAVIFVDDADVAVVQILNAIDPGICTPEIGIHPSAVIDPEAHVAPSASIGPGCIICKDAVVNENTALMANVYMGQSAQVGSDSTIHPGVVIGDRCTLGDRCTVFANSVIGADGFGFLTPTDDRPLTKVPQIGSVEIGDDVEIGACSTIDRAKFGVTRIGHRTKLDNQVHVAHNCIVGNDVLLCGRTTLGGSATIGDRTMVGGAVVLNDQASVGSDVKIAGGAIVLETIHDNETVLGVPAMPARKAMANIAAQRNLAQFCRRVEKSLKKIDPDYKPS